jgi:hypothetical protein
MERTVPLPAALAGPFVSGEANFMSVRFSGYHRMKKHSAPQWGVQTKGPVPAHRLRENHDEKSVVSVTASAQDSRAYRYHLDGCVAFVAFFDHAIEKRLGRLSPITQPQHHLFVCVCHINDLQAFVS